MKFKLLFIFALVFSSLPLCAITQELLDKQLINAIESNSLELVEACLLRGADVNAQDTYGQTALMYAAANGQTKIVKLLIEYDAHLNLSNMEKRTALTIASQEGYTTIVNILLKKGAHVDVDHSYLLLTCLPVVKHPQLIELPLKHINHILDKTDDLEIYHKWDQYILDSLSNIETQWWWTYPIKTINAFRMFLHHASKLPLSTKKLESLIAKALKHRYDGEYAFRKTVEHLRTHAF